MHRLKEVIDKIFKWTNRNLMTVNKTKSGIIFHNNRSRGRKKKRLEDNINGIPIVKTYKYLGIMINESMDFIETNELKIKALARAKKTLLIMKY